VGFSSAVALPVASRINAAAAAVEMERIAFIALPLWLVTMIHGVSAPLVFPFLFSRKYTTGTTYREDAVLANRIKTTKTTFVRTHIFQKDRCEYL
jgi:hypothetical protein